MAIIALLKAPHVQVLGITIVTGDSWRDEEVKHTLRTLELIGRTEVPVAPGAVFPLVRTLDETRSGRALYGQPLWLGVWGRREATEPAHGPYEIPQLPEGIPGKQPLDEDAAHFIIRNVRAHPGQVTIYCGGPLTNIALALSIEPRLAELTKGIVVMGASLTPQTNDPELVLNPRFEFNFWFDPEAARIVLRAPWPRVDVVTIDAAIKTMFTDQMHEKISRSPTLSARYVAKYGTYRWFQYDELAACALIDPSIMKKTHDVYMDIDLSHGPSYGHILTWPEKLKPSSGVRLVHAHVDVDVPKFEALFEKLTMEDQR